MQTKHCIDSERIPNQSTLDYKIESKLLIVLQICSQVLIYQGTPIWRQRPAARSFHEITFLQKPRFTGHKPLVFFLQKIKSLSTIYKTLNL